MIVQHYLSDAPEVYVKSDRIGQLQRKQAVLECHSSAYPPGELVWKKGDKIISKSTWQYEVQVGMKLLIYLVMLRRT